MTFRSLRPVGADRRAVRSRRAALVESLVRLAQEVPRVLAAVHEAGLVLRSVAGLDRRRAAADGDALPCAAGAEIVGGDGAADLIRGQRGALLVGFRQHDRKMRRSVRVQESDRVGIPDGLAQALRQLPQKAFDLNLLELLVDVL